LGDERTEQLSHQFISSRFRNTTTRTCELDELRT